MQPLPSSYRDNDGFVFEFNGKVYRYIHPRYEKHFDRLIKSGLCLDLRTSSMLLAHDEITNEKGIWFPDGRVLLPNQVPFISYPYEWSFDMWKDAALLTLAIAKKSLQKGMMLKDATPFNVQFVKGRPIFIDTLSLEIYEEGKPWVAYRQFCECFLAPLLLMHFAHPDCGKLFTIYPNGIPLDVLVKLLPAKARWNVNTLMHIYLQAGITKKKKEKATAPPNFSKQKLEVILNGLVGYVNKLRVKKVKTTWDDYYTHTILGKDYLLAKTGLVQSFLQDIEFDSVLDLGANDGHFSFLFDNKRVISLDADANCINELYKKAKKENRDILPLAIDLLSPSPAIGWNNAERNSITQRLKADVVLALALVHHLAIANNVPLAMIASWLQPMGKLLVIEFVPKEDEKVKGMLQNREDIFDKYSLADCKEAFADHFEILREEMVGNTGRVLLLMKPR